METVTVTVRTVDGNFKKSVEVPLDMLLGDFREEAQRVASLASVHCYLVGRNNQLLQDSDNFESAGIQSGDLITLMPVCETS
ncbi:MAG: hypothetical protein EAZ09_23165 [Oscillatoriales cyanobacterium]|nr:MAG: hypothetical protein EAZ18_19520 [Oscillatoriales cyanobacterium]TAH15845.1 MAG: hypothetical protein EAZ09_23165 [Oscillatoriales cyanobacterium]